MDSQILSNPSSGQVEGPSPSHSTAEITAIHENNDTYSIETSSENLDAQNGTVDQQGSVDIYGRPGISMSQEHPEARVLRKEAVEDAGHAKIEPTDITMPQEGTTSATLSLMDSSANGVQEVTPDFPAEDYIPSRSIDPPPPRDSHPAQVTTNIEISVSPSVPPAPSVRHSSTSESPRNSISRPSESFEREMQQSSVSIARQNGHPNRTPPPTSNFSHKRSITVSKGNTVSVVLISSALETIASSREAKRSAPLKESVQRALDMVRSGEAGDKGREIFEPLRLACETRNEKLMIASLDCISKLIAYSFFVESNSGHSQSHLSPPPSPGPNGRHFSSSQQTLPEPSLVDIVVHTITSCHTENTPETVSLQIVKALLALVLSPTVLVHQSSLLKAVRTVYNIFLLSTDPVNQTVAQGGLTQIVNHVFARCKIPDATPGSTEGFPPRQDEPELPNLPQSPISIAHLPSVTTPATNTDHQDTQEFSSRSADQQLTETSSTHVPSEIPTLEAAPDDHSASEQDSGEPPNIGMENPDLALETEAEIPNHQLSTNDLFIKDAFLVFRALCKLTMKPVTSESERDLKSHAMRSKLLSLHLVLTILNSHMAIFVSASAVIHSSSNNDATTFTQAINQYLCLCLSRNAVSPIPQVFDICVEIFWRVLSGMRTKLKKEIEVLLHEIFIPILEMKTSTVKQKAVILGMLQRLCEDPQALVEIYLNYDCDGDAADNIYEHLMNIISRIGTAHVTGGHTKGNEPNSPSLSPTTTKGHGASVPPSLSTSALSVSGSIDTSSLGFSEKQFRRQGLDCLVTVLKSLVTWGTGSGTDIQGTLVGSDPTIRSRVSEDTRPEALTPDSSTDRTLSGGYSLEVAERSTPDITDDPSRFESAKQKKTSLLEGIRKFNFKPKKGVDYFIETGFIPSRSPQDIAQFLLETDGLSKAMIGEYLGEGDEENISIMHSFVDLLDFRNTSFVDALRNFLQAFRLPGESQKIDRYMLKFAERYIAGNPQTHFANADTAYILAYSTIMLNTDAHSPQIKNRMTKAQFLKNNGKINDNADLPEEFLLEIYDEIQTNEIRMKDEIDAIVPTSGPGLANALANVGRDLQKEAYVMQTNNMANKTEALFKTLMRSQRKGSQGNPQFFSASHFVHVKPMFEVAWISFLAGLSGPLQETEDNEVVELCLDGFKSAIRIVCFFDLELERNAFVTTLAKFTFLDNLGEMKNKNMEAIKTLLDIAITEGNNLKGSWREVLTCVSQLEHMQLISSGVDVPDSRKGRTRKVPNEELANESRSTHITVATDMVFSLSHYLSGNAIVDFVQALCDISWQEIQSSGLSQHPRLFSLQKLVEISYYNMNRIRLEWSNLWDILGEHFNQVCCHNNPHVGFFALDSLRQLAMRFLEKEELPHFKFQKDFLKPFEYTMAHNSNPDIRDMVLQCLQQMIQARVDNMRSGWRTMFGVFSAASRVPTERIVNSAFEIVTRLNKERFSAIVRHGAFADLTVCITDFCKVSKYQKISLLAIAMLRGVIPVMLDSPQCSLTVDGDPHQAADDDPMIRYWFPVLFGFYDVIMNGDDLEVRRLALDSMFTTLKSYGKSFPVDFWDTVCQELLFPIFAVLKSSQDLSRFNTQEDMSVWLSTTMIQALRDLIDLYTFYFEILERFLDGLLDLLCVCICQENDTLARIGTSCLQQLLENNAKKLSSTRWERVATTFVKLFKTTTPHQLFDEALRVELDGGVSDLNESSEANGEAIIPAPLSPSSAEKRSADAKTNFNDRRRVFKQIIVKCVLQLLLIETTNDLLRNDEVYNTIPPDQLLRFMGVLDHSYQFARLFNEDKELRTGLWKVGFMKHLPNLLKQESSSAATLTHILLRMYYDSRSEHQAARPQVADRLLPLGLGVLQDFNKLRADTQVKNITAWTPVVAEILHGFVKLDDKAFDRYMPAIYPRATELLARDMAPEIRQGLQSFFIRVGVLNHILDANSLDS